MPTLQQLLKDGYAAGASPQVSTERTLVVGKGASLGGQFETVAFADTTVDFGTSNDTTATASVSFPSISSVSAVMCTVMNDGVDHDGEDVAVENVSAKVTSITPDVGFSLCAYAPDGTWGRYKVRGIVI